MISKPSLLVSFAILKEKHLPLRGDGFDEWVLDSGAYSAHNSGKTITNESFIRFAIKACKHDPKLRHVFALDVIGDYKKSLENALAAKAAGLNVIPTWHAGEPIEHAQEMAKQFERVALGGLVARLQNNRSQLLDTATKVHYAEKFFKAVWPKWIHGFGCTAEELMSRLPFSSVDSTTWSLRPSMYGSWKTFGKLPVRVSGDVAPALKAELMWFLRREAFHDAQWRRELAKVNCNRFRIRFACSMTNVKQISGMFDGSALQRLEAGSLTADEEEISEPKPKPEPVPAGTLDEKWAGNWWE